MSTATYGTSVSESITQALRYSIAVITVTNVGQTSLRALLLEHSFGGYPSERSGIFSIEPRSAGTIEKSFSFK